MGSSLALDQIFCACYFGFVRLFFATYFIVSKGSPFNFCLFCKKIDVQKAPFFGTMRFTGDFKKIPQLTGLKFAEQSKNLNWLILFLEIRIVNRTPRKVYILFWEFCSQFGFQEIRSTNSNSWTVLQILNQ